MLLVSSKAAGADAPESQQERRSGPDVWHVQTQELRTDWHRGQSRAGEPWPSSLPPKVVWGQAPPIHRAHFTFVLCGFLSLLLGGKYPRKRPSGLWGSWGLCARPSAGH